MHRNHPSTATPYYTVQIPRGTFTAHHIIHATNGWSSHLLPGLRGKIVPFRSYMTAQRPGTGLPTSTIGSRRAYIFYYAADGFDYLTQLPRHDKSDSDGELLFGGGVVQGGRLVLSDVGVADDSRDASRHSGRAYLAFRQTCNHGPTVISCRAAPPSSLTTVSDNADVSDRARVALPLAPPGEWVSAGYRGEGMTMTQAWLCAHALALMVLGLEKEGVHTWFPDEYRLTEKRWKRAAVEQVMTKI